MRPGSHQTAASVPPVSRPTAGSPIKLGGNERLAGPTTRRTLARRSYSRTPLTNWTCHTGSGGLPGPLTCAAAAMAERRATNKYYPPDWTPDQVRCSTANRSLCETWLTPAMWAAGVKRPCRARSTSMSGSTRCGTGRASWTRASLSFGAFASASACAQTPAVAAANGRAATTGKLYRRAAGLSCRTTFGAMAAAITSPWVCAACYTQRASAHTSDKLGLIHLCHG